MRRLAACCFILGYSGGCAHILKTRDIENGQLGYYTAEGGVIVAMGPGGEDGDGKDSLKNVCLFPPAQAVRLISPEGSVEASADGVFSGNAAGKENHSAHSLYDQSTSTLFLQMAMYRLCEAEANGYLPEPTPCADDAPEAPQATAPQMSFDTRLSTAVGDGGPLPEYEAGQDGGGESCGGSSYEDIFYTILATAENIALAEVAQASKDAEKAQAEAVAAEAARDTEKEKTQQLQDKNLKDLQDKALQQRLIDKAAGGAGP